MSLFGSVQFVFDKTNLILNVVWGFVTSSLLVTTEIGAWVK